MEDTGAKWGSVCPPIHFIFERRTVGINVGRRKRDQNVEERIVEFRQNKTKKELVSQIETGAAR